MPDASSGRGLRPQQARRAVRRIARRAARRLGIQRIQGQGMVRSGVVERFKPPWVEGWIAVPPGAPAVPVTLRVNKTDIVTTWVADPAKRRVPGAEARRFRFVVNEIWEYVSTRDRITIEV